VRALRPGDEDSLRLILEGLRPDSRLQRFLAPRPVYSERDVAAVTEVDQVDHAGVIAFAGYRGMPVGAAHYVMTQHPDVAEVAIEVVDDWQRRGIGRLLAAELRAHALQAGLRRFEWSAFASNCAIAALARDLGDCRRVHEGNGVVKCSAALLP
jgi:RimJ/RimL family protein N-acetyltransferase